MPIPVLLAIAAKMAADKAMSNMAKDDADQENYMESRAAERRQKAPDLASVGSDSSLAQALLSKAVSGKVESLLNKPKETPAPQDKGMAPLTPPFGQDQGAMPRTPPGTDRGFDKAKPLPPAEQFKSDFDKQNPEPSWMQNLQHFADGGIVTSPTLAVIGEKEPEAVIPVSKLSLLQRALNDPSVIGETARRNAARRESSDIFGENTPMPEPPLSKDERTPVDTKRHGFWEKAAGLIGDSPLKGELGASENPFINALVFGAHLYTHSKLKGANDEVAQRQAERKKQLKGWEEEDKQYQRDVRSVARQRIAGRRARLREEAAQRRADDLAAERQQRFVSTHVQTTDGKWAPVPRQGSGKDPVILKIKNFRKQSTGRNRILRNKKSSLMRALTSERNMAAANNDPLLAATLGTQFDEGAASNDRRWQDLQVEEIAENFRSKLYETDDLTINENAAKDYYQSVLSQGIPENMKARIKKAIESVADEHSRNFGGN